MGISLKPSRDVFSHITKMNMRTYFLFSPSCTSSSLSMPPSFLCARYHRNLHTSSITFILFDAPSLIFTIVFTRDTSMSTLVRSICSFISSKVEGTPRKVSNSAGYCYAVAVLIRTLSRRCNDVDQRRYIHQTCFDLCHSHPVSNVGPGCSSSMGLLMELGKDMDSFSLKSIRNHYGNQVLAALT